MTIIRRSIELANHGHGGAPIPAASRVGSLVVTGGIRGIDMATGVLSSDLAEQVAHMFANLRAVIEAGGATVDTIAKVTVWIAVPEARATINGPWQAMFPDPDARPARHVIAQALPGGMLVQCDALAVATDQGMTNAG